MPLKQKYITDFFRPELLPEARLLFSALCLAESGNLTLDDVETILQHYTRRAMAHVLGYEPFHYALHTYYANYVIDFFWRRFY